MQTDPFVPLIDRGVLEASDGTCIEDIVVPLMLVRHVAEPPDAGSFPDAVERLHGDITRVLKAGERQYPFVTDQTEGGVLGIILYPALEKADVLGLSPNDQKQTRRLVLSPTGLHLLHGFLVFIVHTLSATQPTTHPYQQDESRTHRPPENTDVARVREYLSMQVDGADEGQVLTLFEMTVVDTYGRPSRIWARWYPNRDLASWEWRFEEGEPAEDGIAFTLEQAALLSGFLTLLRLAFPDDWSWKE